MMMLKDAPGGADFIDRCVAAAADMSLRFVGTDDEQMLAALADIREILKRSLRRHWASRSVTPSPRPSSPALRPASVR